MIDEKGYRHSLAWAANKYALAHQLSALRAKNRLSQRDLALKAKVPLGVVADLEDLNAAIGYITAKQLTRITNVLGIAVIVRFGPFSSLVYGLAPKNFEGETEATKD